MVAVSGPSSPSKSWLTFRSPVRLLRTDSYFSRLCTPTDSGDVARPNIRWRWRTSAVGPSDALAFHWPRALLVRNNPCCLLTSTISRSIESSSHNNGLTRQLTLDLKLEAFISWTSAISKSTNTLYNSLQSNKKGLYVFVPRAGASCDVYPNAARSTLTERFTTIS